MKIGRSEGSAGSCFSITLVCEFCGKPINLDEEGVLIKGTLYHKYCFEELKSNRAEEELEALIKQFPGMEAGVLEDLLAQHDTLDGLKKILTSDWAAVTDIGDEIEAHSFKTMREMLNSMSDIANEMLEDEGLCFLMQYMLKKGKVICTKDGYDIKVILRK